MLSPLKLNRRNGLSALCVENYEKCVIAAGLSPRLLERVTVCTMCGKRKDGDVFNAKPIFGYKNEQDAIMG